MGREREGLQEEHLKYRSFFNSLRFWTKYLGDRVAAIDRVGDNHKFSVCIV